MKITSTHEKIKQYLEDPYFNPPSDIEYYLNGNCHLFAVALNFLYPLDIYAIYEQRIISKRKTNKEKGLVHAYCYNEKSNIYIDARGITTYKYIEKAYGLSHLSDIIVEKVTDIPAFLNYIEPGYKVDNIRKAVLFIQKYYVNILSGKFQNYSGVKFG